MRPLRRQPESPRGRKNPDRVGRLDPHDAAGRMQDLAAAVHMQRDRKVEAVAPCHHRDAARGIIEIAAINSLGWCHWALFGLGPITTKIDRTSPKGKGYIG